MPPRSTARSGKSFGHRTDGVSELYAFQSHRRGGKNFPFPQEILGSQIALDRAYVHVALSQVVPYNRITRIDVCIQQITQVLVGAMARLPQQLEGMKSRAGSGNRPPDPG